MNHTIERVWIGLGSNIVDPKKQADQAIWAISNLPSTKLVAFSSYYCSRPLGGRDQPCFLNAIVVIDTSLSPITLLYHIQYIEKKQGRVRIDSDNSLWQSRTLDLDVLLFGKCIICSSILTIPHYDMFNREFVMYPLVELDECLIFPDGRIITDIIRTIPKNGLCFWKNKKS